MTSQQPHTPQSDRSRLHRSRQERVLLGVCGGVAEYFGIDPIIVRVAFVLAALIPPFSAVSILGYPLLAILLPVEETAALPGRDQMRSNLDALRVDAGELAGRVRGALSGIAKHPQAGTGGPSAGATTPAPDGTGATTIGPAQPVGAAEAAADSTRSPAQAA